MNNLKKLLATMTLAGIIIIGATSANAGVIFNLSDRNQPKPCTEANDKMIEKVDNGVVFNFTGVIFNLTGVIFNLGGESPVDCGVVFN